MKKRIYTYFVVAALILMCICATVLVACNNTDETTVTNVTVSPNSFLLSVGETQELFATVTYSDGSTDSNVTWSSSATLIATVNESGVVTAKAVGNATIAATAGDKSATCHLTVIAAQSSVSVDDDEIHFDRDELSLTVGEEAVLTVSVYPANAPTNNFTWTVVSDNSVIEVTKVQDGLKVKGISVGKAILKVSSANNPSVTDSIEITVREIDAENIIILNALELEVGATFELGAQISIFPDNASVVLNWSTSNEEVVTVDGNGSVKAVNLGTASITVTDARTGKSATCVVTVVQRVKSIALSDNSLDMSIGATRSVTVNFIPSNATNKGFAVSVDIDGVVTCEQKDTEIVITAIAEGNVKIKVTSLDNGQAIAYCNVTVIQDNKPTLSCSDLTITEIGTISATVTILFDGDVAGFSVASSPIVTVEKMSDKSFAFRSAAFGATTVTVSVTYDGLTIDLPLDIHVVSNYFYLIGPMNGDPTWDILYSEDDARSENRLLLEVSKGIYEITRDFAAGDAFYVLPAEVDDDVTYGLTADFYVTHQSAIGVEQYKQGMKITYAGNYTVRLDLTGEKATWTVICNDVATTSVEVQLKIASNVLPCKKIIWGRKNDKKECI